MHVLESDVATEAGVGGAHEGALEIIEGAVGGAVGRDVRLGRGRESPGCGGLGVEEIARTELVADSDEQDEADGRRELAPAVLLVDVGAGVFEGGGELLLEGRGGEDLEESIARGGDGADGSDGFEGR